MNEDPSLMRIGARTKPIRVFDLLAADLAPIARRPRVDRLIAQQIASTDSIASTIEEGHGHAHAPPPLTFPSMDLSLSLALSLSPL